MDTNKTMLLNSIDTILPIALSLLPEDTRNRYVCKILYDSLKNFNSDEAIKISNNIIYIDNGTYTPFSTLINICQYINELIESSKTDYKHTSKTIKELNTLLLLPSNTIIDKHIEFKLANVDVTSTLNTLIKNGYSHETCDRILNIVHVFIFKILSLQLNDLSVKTMINTIQSVTSVCK